ncbi:GntR family transcriptional regulator [Peptoniphilus equinus]|uniref:GntR family transcriptional regulator n=1 Tax=Peptoniphilus equinus TaxID=3016343 RepID=A0ABY7QVI1_9FIRM|nr:GntR family transcriptional regulator [Peptoniphilus equinus]WBW50050.1 GntR family transcriptional regulator [Peptoniphilus equinus]
MFNPTKPIFIQVAEIIENQILDGSLQPHDQTPSTNEFQQIYAINPATARKGLNLLIEDNVLYKKRGLGMFVSDDAKAIIVKKRQDIFFNEKIPALLNEMARLNIAVETFIEKLSEVNHA